VPCIARSGLRTMPPTLASTEEAISGVSARLMPIPTPRTLLSTSLFVRLEVAPTTAIRVETAGDGALVLARSGM
jgi:hypothetical protein